MTSLLPRRFFARRADVVAPELLGCSVTSRLGGGLVTIRLTEVEAYLGPDDPASHAFTKTARSAVMYGPPGHLYVYFSYGMHWCANVVTGPDGHASAVLLRAGEVVRGNEIAYQRRPAARADRELASGPARLAMTLGLDGTATGNDLCRPGRLLDLRVGEPPEVIERGPRVGISKAVDSPWRFWDPSSSSVSTFRRGLPRRRSGSRLTDDGTMDR